MRRLMILGIMMLWMGCAQAGGEPMQEGQPGRIYTTDQLFEDVVENVKMGVVEQGLLVSGTLHVSDMLNRTAADLGFSEVFAKAESVEFCSAQISHMMAQAAPENIGVCPFTISVYVKKEEPGQVYVSYRIPVLSGDAEEATAAAIELLDDIAQSAL
jgi:uncharacterized protein (DUF302 family)